MSAPIQTILVPIVEERSFEAVSFASILSKAYGKPVCLLCLNDRFKSALLAFEHHIAYSTSSLAQAIAETVEEQDSVMIVWGHISSRRTMLASLKASQELRIPYFYLPRFSCDISLDSIAMPVGFLIEEREKGTWARSLYRAFSSSFTIVKPKDKGSRSTKNIESIALFLDKNEVPYSIVNSSKSSFKVDRDALQLLSQSCGLIMITASREYGLDDMFFGPKEFKLIKESAVPVMVLNPRDDLYVLCGD